MDIQQIFKEGAKNQSQNIIKYVKVDVLEHKAGIANLINHFEPKYKYTKENKYILEQLFYYFTGSELFSGDLSKGILLTGSIGVGKTLILENVFKAYTKGILKINSYQCFRFKDLAKDFKTDGEKAFEKIENCTALVDDLGAGDYIILNFGNKINLIDKTIDTRYIVYSKYNKLTHATTNLYMSELKEICDARTMSRISEMFNILELKDKDHRKK